jgi:tetratricopeptide (TPR) repeat protein
LPNTFSRIFKAFSRYTKALKIQEKVLGKNHPDTATTYNNIAITYYKQGKPQKALAYLEKALKIQEKVLGKEHPATKSIQNDIDYVKSHMK